MNIISGKARGVALIVPPGSEVRPTSGRAREALFSSLGDLTGKRVLDLFSGSGAIALEAASRGAEEIAMVEISPDHISAIRENCRRCAAAGVTPAATILDFDATRPARYLPRLSGKFDLVFADPPYAQSAEYFRTILRDEHFRAALAGAKLIWEIPDTPGAAGLFLQDPPLKEPSLRRFGGTLFLIGTIG